MVEIDKKLLRKIRESDTRVIEKRGVNDEEEDENVKALKRQLAEMKQLMKKNATESPGKTKKNGRKKKTIQKTQPHPPLLEEKNHVVQQSIQRSAFDVPTKKVDSKLVEEKKNKKTENNVEEKEEKEKEKAAQQLEKKDAENNAEEKEKEKAAQQLEKMEAKSTTPIKSKPESKELIAKKMVIMKKIRNLKLSLLSIEDETDKIPVKKKINLLTTKLTNLTEEDVINDTKEDAEEGKLNETKPAQDNKALQVQQEKKTSLNRVKTAAKVVATTTKKKDDKCSVM
jgi:hypothetical protein